MSRSVLPCHDNIDAQMNEVLDLSSFCSSLLRHSPLTAFAKSFLRKN